MKYQDRNSMNEYLWKIGDKRIERLFREYTAMGYIVITNQSNHVGVDVILISSPEGRIVKVIEATNYRRLTKQGKPEYISHDKMVRYITALNWFDGIEGIKKELIVSYKENITPHWYKRLMDSKITVVIVGYQE